MSDSQEKPEEPLPRGDLWVDRFIYPALRESTLLPLWLVVIGHVVAFVAPALVFGLRDGSFAARIALLGLLFGTVECTRFEWKRRGRPDLISAMVYASWLLGGAAAWAADRYHLL